MSSGSIPEVFIDTDVAIDLLTNREPHFASAAKILSQKIAGQINLVISSTCVPTLIYLCQETYKIQNADLKILNFLETCIVLNPSSETFKKALKSDFKDKEDAIQYFMSLEHQVDYFVTRNIRDYLPYTDKLQVLEPTDFLNLLTEE